MLLPQTANFNAIIGATFNESITLYQALNQSAWKGVWNSTVAYSVGAAVQGSNGNMYQALLANTKVDPTVDVLGNWTPLLPFNLSGYTGSFQIGILGNTPSLTLISGVGLTLGGISGLVQVVATPVQTATFPVSRQHFYLQLTSGGTIIVPLKGQVNFIAP